MFQRGMIFLVWTAAASVAGAQQDNSARAALLAAFEKGHALWQQGKIADAVPHFEEAVRLAPNVLDDLNTADLHNRLGLLYYHTSQFALAEAQFRHALRLREKKLGRDHVLVAESLNNLAIQLKEQGRYDQAEPPLRRALEIQEKAAPGKPAVADSLDNLAFLCQMQDRHDEAGRLFARALAIRKDKLGEDHPETAQSLRNVADQLRREGKIVEARAYYEKSLRIWEKAGGPRHRKVAISLHSLALLELAQGHPDKALPLLERCADIMRGNGRRDDPEVSVGLALDNLAVVHGCRSDWMKAVAAMAEAQQTYLRFINDSLPSQPEAEQLTFLRTGFEPTLHRGLSLGLAGRSVSRVREQSAEWLLNGKGVVHRALAERALLARDRQDPATAALAGKLIAAREERARLTFLARGRAADTATTSKLADLARQERDLIREMGERRGRVTHSGGVTLDQVRAALSPDEVLIEIARFDRIPFQAGPEMASEACYAAWVIPAAGKGPVQVVDLGPARLIEKAVARARRSLQTGAARSGRRDETKAEKELSGPLEELSRRVVHPLLEHLGSAHRWVVSPDGELWLVPWAALRLPSGRYVVEDHEIRYVLSGRDLVGKAKSVAPDVPLVLADPDFDLDLRAKPAEESAPSAMHWQRLPGTAAEAQAIAPALEKLAGVRPHVLVGAKARKRAFKASPNPRVLVLSTHGFFLADQSPLADTGSRGGWRGMVLDEDADTFARPARKAAPGDNPLLRCGLVLAGANHPAADAKGDNGVLTGLEIVGADLRGTELVVLSACETGLGQVHQGEGVTGLRQAFQLAGTKAVAATLWKVADRETAELVAALFDQLSKGRTPAAALRSAQLAMIKQRRKQHGAAHPYFWASFTLTGR